MTSKELVQHREISPDQLTVPAYAWSLAEQNTPQELAQRYRSDELVTIALSLLTIQTGSLEFQTSDLEASLNKGTGNAYWDDRNAVSWIFGFRERLQHSIPLLTLIPYAELAKKASHLSDIYQRWISRLLYSALPEDQKITDAEFVQFCAYAAVWNEIWAGIPGAELINLNDFERILLSRPKKTAELRQFDLQRSAELTYGLTVDDAIAYLDQSWQRQAGVSLAQLTRLPAPTVEAAGQNNLQIQTVIDYLVELTKVEFGITVTDYIAIEGRSAKKSDEARGLYDQLLETYPAYYYAGKNILVYNIHAPASMETCLLLVHECWGHVVTDIFNSLHAQNQFAAHNNQQAVTQNIYHRSLPDVHEETLAILFEWTMGERFAKLLGNTGVDQTRSFFNLYRGWADYAYNYQGLSLAEVTEQLNQVLDEDKVFSITKTIQLKPGMYLFSYTALPEAVLTHLSEKSYKDSSIISFVKGITTSGTSWKFPAISQIPTEKRLPYFSPGERNPFFLGSHTTHIQPLDHQTALAVAQVRPGQVLRQKDLDTWIYWLRILNGKDQKLRKQTFTENQNQSNLVRLINNLETRTRFTIPEYAAIDNLYGDDVEAPNPAIQIMELFELIYYAVLAEFPESLPLQTEMLTFLHAQVQTFYKNQELFHYQKYPVYVLNKASKTAADMSQYIKGIAWIGQLLQPAMRLATDLETLSRGFKNLATETAGPRRTNQRKYTDYTMLHYQKTPVELRNYMRQLLNRFQSKTRPNDQPQQQYLDGYIAAKKIYQWLGVDFFPNLTHARTGSFENPEGLAYFFPAEQISINVMLAYLERKKVVDAITEQELLNISENELTRLFYDNLLADMAKVLSMQNILHIANSNEVDSLVVKDFIYVDRFLFPGTIPPYSHLEPFEALGDQHSAESTVPIVFPFSDRTFSFIYSQKMAELLHILLQDQSSEESTPKLDTSILAQCRSRIVETNRRSVQPAKELTEISINGQAQTALMHTDPDDEYTLQIMEEYCDFYLREILEPLYNLPTDHPLVILAIQFGLMEDHRRVTNKPQRDIFVDYYKRVSNGVWRSRIESEIAPPLKHLSVPILIHESLHGLIELAARSADHEKHWASRIHYGTQTESLPTFLAWYLTNKTDPELASAYMQYICYSALGEISLNYGLDEENPLPSTMAKVYDLYREYLTDGQAAYLANLHTKSQRSKPWRLSYVADFELWEQILESIKKYAPNERISILFLLTLGMYNPQDILTEIRQSESNFQAAIVDFSKLQKTE